MPMPTNWSDLMQQFMSGMTSTTTATEGTMRDPRSVINGLTFEPIGYSGQGMSDVADTTAFRVAGGGSNSSIAPGWQEIFSQGDDGGISSSLEQMSGGWINDPTNLAMVMAAAIGGGLAMDSFGAAGAGSTAGTGAASGGAGIGSMAGVAGEAALPVAVGDLGIGAAGGTFGIGGTAADLGGVAGAAGGAAGGASSIAADAGLAGGLDAGSISGASSLGGVGVSGGGTVGGGALNASGGLSSLLDGNFSPSNILDLIKGGTGLVGAFNQKGQGAGAADPFASQRSQYQSQLAALMSNFGQTDVTKLPGFKAGQTAVERSKASQGYQASGNMMAALQEYGQSAYQQNIQNQLAQAGLLSTLSGATTGSPAAAGQLTQSGNTNAWNLGGQALNSLAYAATNIWG